MQKAAKFFGHNSSWVSVYFHAATQHIVNILDCTVDLSNLGQWSPMFSKKVSFFYKHGVVWKMGWFFFNCRWKSFYHFRQWWWRTNETSPFTVCRIRQLAFFYFSGPWFKWFVCWSFWCCSRKGTWYWSCCYCWFKRENVTRSWAIAICIVFLNLMRFWNQFHAETK